MMPINVVDGEGFCEILNYCSYHITNVFTIFFLNKKCVKKYM